MALVGFHSGGLAEHLLAGLVAAGGQPVGRMLPVLRLLGRHEGELLLEGGGGCTGRAPGSLGEGAEPGRKGRSRGGRHIGAPAVHRSAWACPASTTSLMLLSRCFTSAPLVVTLPLHRCYSAPHQVEGICKACRAAPRRQVQAQVCCGRAARDNGSWVQWKQLAEVGAPSLIQIDAVLRATGGLGSAQLHKCTINACGSVAMGATGAPAAKKSSQAALAGSGRRQLLSAHTKTPAYPILSFRHPP